MTVTVYSKPVCVQCNATYRALDKAGIDYEVIDVTMDDDAFLFITDTLGFAQAPVVVTDDDAWSGFQPDRLAELARRIG